MALLERIGRFFDPIRKLPNGSEKLKVLRQRLRTLERITTKDRTTITKDSLQSFLHQLFDGVNTNSFSLSDNEVCEILNQLNKSLEGSTYDKDILLACWNFWLQDKISSKSALIIVDVQNDFITGSLALKNCPAGYDGYDVIPKINDFLHKGLFDTVVYTQDWHPVDHCSFIENIGIHPVHHSSLITASEAKVLDTVVLANPRPIQQKLWPAHCVIDTWGAELHTDLKAPEKKDIITKKGSNPLLDSYSAFWNNAHFSQTDLFEDLLAHSVTDVYVCGLAFDYCVEFTAADAALHGFRTHIIEDATAIISHEGCQNSKDNLCKTSVKLIDSENLFKSD